jgi:sensor histidine kinase YesM
VQDGIQWHKVSTQRLSVFNLDPGNYNFEIYSKVKNSSSRILKLSFIVDKPFYLKWWAILIFVFIIVSVIVYIIKYRRRKKKLEVRLLQNELDMLQKQLNPHFVSNALNSLQSLILDDDFVKTNIFISNFSSLLRFSLRYSKKLFIGLSEELNYIESFIKLHQITNRKRFKYEIYLSKEVELIARDILVPPFFMQPIIENAIVHGFDNSSSDNILVIEVVLNDDFVEVRIVDNGIGYNNADDNNKGSGRGISSIMERIVIYKDLEDYKISFSIGNSEILDFGTIAQLIFEKRINDERKV